MSVDIRGVRKVYRGNGIPTVILGEGQRYTDLLTGNIYTGNGSINKICFPSLPKTLRVSASYTTANGFAAPFFSTIADAMAAMATGDLLILDEGTYAETMTPIDGISVIGVSEELVKVQALNVGVLNVELQNFTVTGAAQFVYTQSYTGGAFLRPMVTGVKFTGDVSLGTSSTPSKNFTFFRQCHFECGTKTLYIKKDAMHLPEGDWFKDCMVGFDALVMDGHGYIVSFNSNLNFNTITMNGTGGDWTYWNFVECYGGDFVLNTSISITGRAVCSFGGGAHVVIPSCTIGGETLFNFQNAEVNAGAVVFNTSSVASRWRNTSFDYFTSLSGSGLSLLNVANCSFPIASPGGLGTDANNSWSVPF